MARYPTSTMVRLEDQRPLSVRKTRSPQHSWQVAMQPWQQVPVLCAPVLPGETLKSASVQARVMSDPIASRLQGWWLEFYLFYVRVGDLDEATEYREVCSGQVAQGTSVLASGSYAYYHFNAARPSFAQMCHKVVSRAYFRKEGEAWNAPMLGVYPAVQVAGRTWLDSVYTDSAIGAPAGSDAWGTQWAAFQQMEATKLTTNTWEEYLAKQGVRVPPQMRTLDAANADVPDLRIPELVRFVRDFAYPVPTVDPSSGVIRSTVQWSLAERIDKRRYFAEPGFLFGLMVVRPKVYLANNLGSLVDFQCFSNSGWLPPEFDTDPHTALVKTTADQLFGGSVSTPCWYDQRDLYLYGDQWLGPDATGAAGITGGLVQLPVQDLSNVKYPSLTDAHAMFVTSDGTQSVRADGICSLRIASRLGAADTTT